MTATLAIRKARELDDYPPLRLVPERALRQIERVEQCVCGDRIYQLAGDETARTVAQHNATGTHQRWRAEQ